MLTLTSLLSRLQDSVLHKTDGKLNHSSKWRNSSPCEEIMAAQKPSCARACREYSWSAWLPDLGQGDPQSSTAHVCFPTREPPAKDPPNAFPIQARGGSRLKRQRNKPVPSTRAGRDANAPGCRHRVRRGLGGRRAATGSRRRGGPASVNVARPSSASGRLSRAARAGGRGRLPSSRMSPVRDHLVSFHLARPPLEN